MASIVAAKPPSDSSVAAAAAAKPARVSGFAHEVLLEPTELPSGLEVSVHTLPRMVKRELKMVFTDVSLDGMLAVLTAQHAAMDLVATGPDVADEKDSLLETVCSQTMQYESDQTLRYPCSLLIGLNHCVKNLERPATLLIGWTPALGCL